MKHPTRSVLLAAAALAALGGCSTTLGHEGASTTNTAPSPATPSSSTSATQAAGLPVVRVVDGDTIVVLRNGVNVTVRVIGIDTPETVKPGAPVGMCGPEASRATHGMLDGKAVNLVPDPTQDAADKYGRTLAYVEVDGKDVGFELVINGLALPYKYRNPAPQRYATYVAAQGVAQGNHLGIYGTECKAT